MARDKRPLPQGYVDMHDIGVEAPTQNRGSGGPIARGVRWSKIIPSLANDRRRADTL